MKITAELLDDLGACEKERKRFALAFPDGLPIDDQTVERARAERFPVTWGLRYLPGQYLETFWAEMAENSEWYLRCAVAGNPDTPAAFLRALAEDPDHLVRGAVAFNASTPAMTLVSLAEDAKTEVRKAAERTLERLEK